jgi:hypothetical protein
MTLGIDLEAALSKLTSCRTIQNAFGADQDGLARRLAIRWTPELALRDCELLPLLIFSFPSYTE